MSFKDFPDTPAEICAAFCNRGIVVKNKIVCVILHGIVCPVSERFGSVHGCAAHQYCKAGERYLFYKAGNLIGLPDMTAQNVFLRL